MQETNTIKVVIVDDGEFVREMLKDYLSEDPSIQVVGTASDGHSAIASIQELHPDIAILDIEMPGLDGISACRAIVQRFPSIKVLILSSHDDAEYLNRAIQMGAKGYLHKATPPDEIIAAVHSIHKGYFQLGPGMHEQIVRANNSRGVETSGFPANGKRSNSGHLNVSANSGLDVEDPQQPYSSNGGDSGKETAPDPYSMFDDAAEMQKSGLKWLLTSSLVGLLAVGGWFGYAFIKKRPSPPVSSANTAVQRQTLENLINVSGIVELGGQQIIKAPGDVTVESVLVREQQQVEEGDVLLVLRDRQLQQEIDEQLIQQSINTLEVQRQEELLALQELVVSKARESLAESQLLVEEGVISREAYKEDVDTLDEAESRLRTVRIDLNRARLTLQQDEARLTHLESQFADNQIRAPFDANILKVDVQPGDGVQREKPLLVLGDPLQEIIRFQLTILDAQWIEIGMPVRVSVIGPNPQEFAGQVVWISRQAIGEEEEDEEQTQSKIDAIAVLDRPSGQLIPGSGVSVEVIVDRREDVLSVPLNAVFSEGDRHYVWVSNSLGSPQRKEVDLGLQNLTFTEILSGLDEGDRVLLSSPSEQE